MEISNQQWFWLQIPWILPRNFWVETKNVKCSCNHGNSSKVLWFMMMLVYFKITYGFNRNKHNRWVMETAMFERPELLKNIVNKMTDNACQTSKTKTHYYIMYSILLFNLHRYTSLSYHINSNSFYLFLRTSYMYNKPILILKITL